MTTTPFLFTLLGCGLLQNPNVTVREGKPTVYHRPANDKAMNDAMDEARATLDTFVSRLESPPETQVHIGLKGRFVDGAEVEHIWLDDVEHTDGKFAGSIANEPLNVHHVKLAQRVTLEAEEVSDWMAIDAGLLVGGYTIRALRDRMSKSEREQFDASVGFRFE